MQGGNDIVFSFFLTGHMCLAGGAIFAVALGCVSNFILQKQDLV